MKLANFLLAVLFVFCVFGAGLAQDKQAVEPDWALVITTTGGFHGNGKGNFLVTSQGKVYRLPTASNEPQQTVCEGLTTNSTDNCRFEMANLEQIAPLAGELFNSLTQTIDALPNFDVLRKELKELREKNAEIIPASVCSDCYQTIIRLTRRELDGKKSNFVITVSDFQQIEKLSNLIKLTDEIINSA